MGTQGFFNLRPRFPPSLQIDPNSFQEGTSAPNLPRPGSPMPIWSHKAFMWSRMAGPALGFVGPEKWTKGRLGFRDHLGPHCLAPRGYLGTMSFGTLGSFGAQPFGTQVRWGSGPLENLGPLRPRGHWDPAIGDLGQRLGIWSKA